jgi:hypothetical protein
MGWFAIGFAIGFLSYNDHLQFITMQCISMGVNVIKQVAWIAKDTIHYMWNRMQMWLVQLSYDYVGITTM